MSGARRGGRFASTSRVFVTALFALAAAATMSSACLEDLPPATECPPGATHAAGDCTSVFMNPQPNCITSRPDAVDVFSCFTGARDSCECGADECSSNADACYPSGDCPPEVVAAAGKNVKCIRLDPEDFDLAGDIPQCICGCASCASVCDGHGPVIGVVDVGQADYTYPAIDLRKHMPSSGKIGFYVRARGVANVSVAALTGEYPTSLDPPRSVYYMTTALDEFTTQIFYGPDFIGNNDAYSWTDEAGAPTTLLLANSTVQSPGDPPIVTFYELDCIIPFVVPN
jgi:hypothetical protein